MAAKLTLVVGLWLLVNTLVADDSSASPPREPATLETGATLPALEALDDRGQRWHSTDHVGRKTLVLYFYPGDFTTGCIRQAQSFREELTRLSELDVEVVGVSGDEVTSHQLFKDTHGLTHTLLADPEGTWAARLGIPLRQNGKPVRVRAGDVNGKPLLNDKGEKIVIERKVTYPRWTVIVGRDGKIASTRTTINPRTDAEETVKIVKMLMPAE